MQMSGIVITDASRITAAVRGLRQATLDHGFGGAQESGDELPLLAYAWLGIKISQSIFVKQKVTKFQKCFEREFVRCLSSLALLALS